MKRNRIIVAVLAAVLTLSGCACENNKDKKDEKVVQKKQESTRYKMLRTYGISIFLEDTQSHIWM